ncbi:MAG: glutathione-disulfide reductase [Betaproteobacteria bacterium]|nr:glutathione-disulfide reductase [Betaproteobacteria bacterium]
MAKHPESFDLIVIGGGSGGVRAARRAAAQQASVALFEGGRLGGTCVNVGCVPKKVMSFAAHAPATTAAAVGHGWPSAATGNFSWPDLRQRLAAYITDLNAIYRRNLEKAGVTIFDQRARLTGANSVEAGGKSYEAKKILIATGARPALPPVPGLRELACTSDDMFSLPKLPATAIIAGAGYIAVEFASILAGLGVATTLVHRGPTILKNFDVSVQKRLLDHLRAHQVQLRLDTDLEKVEKTGSGVCVCLRGGDQLQADLLLAATGRIANTDDLGAAEAGVKLGSRGQIIVDDNFRSSVSSIYALGDVIGRLALTPVAIAEGMRFVAENYGGYGPPLDYDLVPTAVFSHPNVGSVGMSEQQARQAHPEVLIAESEFTSMISRIAGTGDKTYMKLIHLPDNGRVLGAHMVGPDAGEIMQGFAVALGGGATKLDFDATVGIHPTAAEEFVSMR